MLKIGVEDAGRGPVLGPMIMAGCLINEATELKFKEAGVRDSKQLTQKRREFFETLIKESSIDFHTIAISPEEIDTKNAEGVKLNEVEAIAAAKIIDKLNPGKEKIKVILDCPSTSIVKWQDFLKTQIKNLSNLDVSCEHKADRNHVVVSAASILAKTERESQMTLLRKKYGDEIGSGYTSDPVTQRFVAKNANNPKHKELFRKTWKTWQNASGNEKQRKLF